MEYLLALLPLTALVLAWRDWLHGRRLAKQRDFARRLETVLLPKETVKVILPQKKGSAVLTSKRVLLETGTGFTAIKIIDIKKTSGLSEEGKKTASVPKMVCLTFKASEEYTVTNTGEEFGDFVKQLTAKVKKQNEKKMKKL